MNLRCTNPALLIYLLWVYALPAFLNSLFDYESDIYFNPSISLVSWLYGTLMFAITLAFAFRLDVAPRQPITPSFVRLELPWLKIIGVIICLVLIGVIGAISELSQWRYAADGLSSSLDPISLLFVLTPNILELFLFALVFYHYDMPHRTARCIAILLVFGLALTASGILPMINVLIALVAAVAPLTFRRLLIKPHQAQKNIYTRPIWGKLVLLVPLFCCLMVVAYFVGNTIKTGSTFVEVIDNATESDLKAFLYYVIGRISVHWYSITAALYHMVELGEGDPLHNLMAPLTNAVFRFSSLTGGWLGIERPLDGSMARINYTLMTLYPFNEREGTSPGLIATFILAFPIWLGPFALAGYLWVYDKLQSGLRSRFAGKPTMIGEVLLLYFTIIIFASPVDFLLVFDPMLLSLLVLCYLGLSGKTVRKHDALVQPN